MSKSSSVILLILVVLVAGGIVVYAKNHKKTPVATTNQNQTSQNSSTNEQNPAMNSTISGSVVTYTDNGFSPKTLQVRKGTTVTFKNGASDDMRVASNPHPLHNGYPTTGGCVASTFDACMNIIPGSSWSFKFDIPGTWGYHNHLNPSEGGTIVVTP